MFTSVPSSSSVTGNQAETRHGGSQPPDVVDTRVYQELRLMAHRRLAGRNRGGTLSTTALVHEAYLKLAGQSNAAAAPRDRAHLLAVASLAMRHVLVDRARERNALKRGGERQRVTLDEVELSVDAEPEV